MHYKIVSDSSSNVLSMEGPFASVPMKVRTAREYIDDARLDLAAMVEDLRTHKGPSGSACPSVGEWLEAFGDAQWVFGTTISGKLSGSFNSACQAARAYMEEHPGRKAFILDSKTAGPEQAFFIDKFRELADQGLDFDTIVEKIREYQDHTHTLFCLESMLNLARNGRVPMAVAKIGGMLGIRVCGIANDGQIAPVHKPRGARKAMETLAQMIRERGFGEGSRLRIAHCFGQDQAQALAAEVRKEFPNARIELESTTALCSFYAETGGLMIGFEGGYNEENHN